MTHRGGRAVLAGTLILAIVLLGGCGVLPGSKPLGRSSRDASTPTAPPPPKELAVPLDFRPVTALQPGACAAGSTDAVDDPGGTGCFSVGPSRLSVHKVKSAGIKLQQTTWVVEFQLDDADGQAFAQLTNELATEQDPRNRMVMIIGVPPAGDVLAVPVVNEKISDGAVWIFQPQGQDAARKLADRLLGR